MGGTTKLLGEVHVRTAVGGGLLGLDACNFQSKIVQESLALGVLFGFIRESASEEFPWDCKAFAKNQVGRRSAYIWFQGCPYCQEGAWKSPIPHIRFVRGKGIERFFQASVKSLDKTIRLRMVSRREM